MTNQDDPFGPPPTHPPSFHDEQESPIARHPHEVRHLRSITEHRFAVIWLGAIATVAFSGLTGLLLDTRWSYLSLGLTFAALMIVVVAVSTPSTGTGDANGAGLGR